MSSTNAGDSFAKELLKRFVVLDFEKSISFRCPANMGDIIIQRMRVRLSRVRKKAKKQGRIIQEFKMIKISATPETVDGQQMETIILKKTKNSITDAVDTLEKLLTDIPIAYPVKSTQRSAS